MRVCIYVQFVFAGQIFNPDGEEIWDTLPPPRHKMRHLSVSLI